MTAQLSSGIYLEEQPPQIRAIAGTSPSIGAALVISERGPFDTQLITSFDDFKRLYGDDIAASDSALALRGFFQNGGRSCYIKRVVHYTDASDAATKQSAEASLTLNTAPGQPTAGAITGSFTGAFNVQDGQTLVVSIDGGNVVTATFNGDPAQLESADGPFALTDGATLEVVVDSGAVQTLTFDDTEFTDVAQATPTEVAASISSKLVGGRAVVSGDKVVLEGTRRGTSARIKVNGGTANGALGFPTTEASGDGNVANLAAVTVSEAAAVLTPVLSGAQVTSDAGKLKIASATTGPQSSVRVDAASTARTAFGFDTVTHAGATGDVTAAIEVRGKTDGSYANRLSVIVAAPTSGRASEFNLTVIDANLTVKERWPNLSIDPTSPAFFEAVVNNTVTGSQFIKLAAPGAAVQPQPGTYGPLTGGADGLSGISDADFIGSSTGKTGLHGFDIQEDARILFVPDRQTAVMDVAMLQYVTLTKRGSMFAVLSSARGQTFQQYRDYVEDTAGLYNLTEFGATYYPQIKVLNPNTAVYGSDETLVVSPVGHIAGAYARQDGSRAGGIYEAAAGVDRGQLVGVVGLENTSTQEEAVRDILYPSRINPIRLVGGLPVLDGARTLKGDGNFPTIPERRGVIYIEQAILRGTEFARFRNNDAELRAELTRTIEAFLETQMFLGAFRTRSKASAFFVDITEGLNPPSVVFAGCVIGAIGLATQKPAEFIIFRVRQDTRALQAELNAVG